MSEQLAELMPQLQPAGCHNINLVTPEHVVPQILEALLIAVERGLRLPLVYNTSAFGRAIKTMHGRVGELRMDERGLALRGVLVRHFVMPGLLDDTRAILQYLAQEVSRDTYVNLMNQYAPAWRARTQAQFAEINRRVSNGEFIPAVKYAREAGLLRSDAHGRLVFLMER